MNRKTCLMQLILILVVVIVVAGGIRRWLTLRSETASASVAQDQGAKALDWLKDKLSSDDTEAKESAIAASAHLAAPPAATAGPSGVENMSLQLSRPLMIETQPSRGIAVREQHIYLTASDLEQHTAYLYQLDCDRLYILQLRSLAQGDRWLLGGLDSGPSLLWTALSSPKQGAGSRIIGFDPGTLEERTGWEDEGRITAVAQHDNGTVYGYCNEAKALIAWSLEGNRIATQSLATGADYVDMDCAGNSLVCAGTLYAGNSTTGVLDLIDTETLSLLERLPFYGVGPDGRPLTAHGFALTDRGLVVVEWRNERNQILSYAPVQGHDIQDIFVSVAPDK